MRRREREEEERRRRRGRCRASRRARWARRSSARSWSSAAYIIVHGHLTPAAASRAASIAAGALLLAYAAGQGVRLGACGSIAPARRQPRRSARPASLALGDRGPDRRPERAAEELPGARDVGDAAVGGDDPGAATSPSASRSRAPSRLVFAEFLEQALLEDSA